MQTRRDFTLMKKLVLITFYGLSLIILSLSFLNRDTRLQNQLAKNLGSEFDSTPLLCSDFPGCFRITSALIGKLLAQINDFIGLRVFFSEPTNTSYITLGEKMELISSFSSIIVRVILILPLLVYFYKLVKHNQAALAFVCLSGASIISAYPLIFLDSFFDMYLTLTDYGSLFIVGLLLNYRDKLVSNSFYWTLFNILAVLTFENLGFVLAVALFFIQKKTKIKQQKLIFISLVLNLTLPAILVCIQFLSHPNQGVLFPKFGYYGSSNLQHLHELFLALVLIFTWPLLLGVVGRVILGFGNSKIDSDAINHANYWPKALLCGFLASYVIGLINSGLASEGARQTLAGQVIFFLVGLSYDFRIIPKRFTK